MNLSFARSASVRRAWVGDATEFAEVVYRADDVLVVSVAEDLAEDSLLTNALMDLIATCEECDAAEAAIKALVADLDLALRSGEGRVRGERHLTISPRAIS